MTKGRFFLLTFLVAGVLFALWLGGLMAFVAQINLYAEQRPVLDEIQPVDALVVLTGGSERIQEGLDLLRAGKGKKLFISGVHPGVSRDRLLARDAVSEELRTCCVLLGHAADNTRGNAAETKTFMQAEGFVSLRLVTANYHMPRSLLYFQQLMPEIKIVPNPVSPDIVNLKDWWTRLGTTSLLIGEYNKYIYARLSAALGVL